MSLTRRPVRWITIAGLLAVAAAAGGTYWRSSRTRGDLRTATVASEEAALDRVAEPAIDAPAFTLPETERAYLWQIEHFVVVLDFKFWPGLSQAIRDQDRDAAGAFFRADAQAEVFAAAAANVEALALGRFEARSVPNAETRRATTDEILDHLLGVAAQCDSGRQVTIKTVSLSPKDRDQPDGPWRGQCLMRVWGQRGESRPAEHVLVADFTLAELTDEVPQPAAWLSSFRVVEQSSRQADRFLMAEVGRDWGFDRTLFHDNWQSAERPRVMTGGTYLTDYDLDGRIDVLITDPTRNVLYRQRAPGKFEDVTEAAQLGELPHGGVFAFADLDNDTYPDLIAGNQLYRNSGRGTFERAAELDLPSRKWPHAVAVADYDRDGRLDLYVARAAPSPLEHAGQTSWLDDGSGPGNTLLRNVANWRFEDVTESAGAAAGTVSCLGAAWFDANDDLWPDLFVGDEFGSPVLLVNRQNGTFESRTVTGDFGGFNMGAAAGDLDDDGRIDLYVANMYSKAGERVLSNVNFDLYPPETARRIRHIVDGSELWHNRGELGFEATGRAAGVARVGWAYGPCLADFDNDGRLDIYAPAGFYSVSRDQPDG